METYKFFIYREVKTIKCEHHEVSAEDYKSGKELMYLHFSNPNEAPDSFIGQEEILECEEDTGYYELLNNDLDLLLIKENNKIETYGND